VNVAVLMTSKTKVIFSPTPMNPMMNVMNIATAATVAQEEKTL
jgi:cystathionine beta-lyase/cystathionine gamma-synthase